MPRTHIYNWPQGRENLLSTKSPLDSEQPPIGQDEPRSNYHKEWGYFAFIYENAETIAMGGLGGLVGSVGNVTINPPSLWEMPNLELGNPVSVTAPEGAPLEDLVDQLCSEANMEANPTIQSVCITLASTDGCKEVESVLPTLTQAPSFDVGNILFPGGHKISAEFFTGSEFCQPGIRLVRITACKPGNGGCQTCQDFYFSNPTSHSFDSTGHLVGSLPCGPNDVRPAQNFATAMTTAMNCVRTFFGGTFKNAGCTFD